MGPVGRPAHTDGRRDICMAALAELFDAGVEVSPPLDAEALKAIPAKRGVFVMVAGDGRPILLTTAASIRARLRHRLTCGEGQGRQKSADLRAVTAAVWWRLTYSPFQTDWQFLELSRAIWPDSYSELLPRRPAWFVAEDWNDRAPCFRAVNGLAGKGEHFGPFRDRRSAQGFIDALADVFDLCRRVSVLRQAPHAAACAYKQMGRCPAPCDGTTPMAAYRAEVARAAVFVGGRRDPQRRRLGEEMAAAAEALQFERAGVLRGRLDRSKQFDEPRFAHVRDVRAFRFVIVQAGPTSRQACTFLCDRGAIAAGPLVEYPPVDDGLAGVLAACDELSAAHEEVTREDRQRMGLVAAYLFSDKSRRGLLLRRDGLTSAGMGELIRSAREALKLHPPGRRAKGAGVGGRQKVRPAATVDE